MCLKEVETLNDRWAGAAAERVNIMAGVISIYPIPQNEVCKWHVNSVNRSVFVCM